MENKKCVSCGATKPINKFYKLRADREWRRCNCADCHRFKDKENRKARNLLRQTGAAVLLFLISFGALSQSLTEKRQVLVDSINYYREAPVERVAESYGIKLHPQKYKAIHSYEISESLNAKAQRYAEKMARTGDYRHSNLKGYNAESIDAINEWQGDYSLSIERFIIDKGNRLKGHRIHMLKHSDKEIGVGIASSYRVPFESKNYDTTQKFYYVCIVTK